MTDDTKQALATLEAELATFLAVRLPALQDAPTLKLRASRRRHCLRSFFQRKRCLLLEGHDRDWRARSLPREDDDAIEQLVQQMAAQDLAPKP